MRDNYSNDEMSFAFILFLFTNEISTSMAQIQE